MDAFMAAISFIGDRARVAAKYLRVVVREDDVKSSPGTMRSPPCGSTVRAVERLVGLVRTYAFDAIVVVLAIGAQIEFWRLDDRPAALIPLGLTVTLPLLAVRKIPLVAPLLVLASINGLALLKGAAIEDSVALFFAGLATAWAIGRFNGLRTALVGLAVLWITLVDVSYHFEENALGDYIWIIAFFSVAWLAGAAFHRRELQAHELRQRAQRLEAERETLIGEERRRIARELHDVVAHSVSVMTVQAGGVRRLLRADQEREREALLAVENTGREALTEMRRLLGMLRDTEETPSLAPQPGVENIGALVDAVRDAGLSVDYRVTGDPVPLPPGIDVSAYRIVQEALTNALKHAGPARAEVVVRYADDRLELEIVNDGAAEPNGASSGHGLVGMEERVALYGGKLEAGPRREGGYAVRAELPVKEPKL
jgi:signal transduction histidine kinase